MTAGVCRWCGVRLYLIRDAGITYCGDCDTPPNDNPFRRSA